jgi:hypothetical protein
VSKGERKDEKGRREGGRCKRDKHTAFIHLSAPTASN